MGDTGVRCPGCARADAGGAERGGAAVSRRDGSAGGRGPGGRGSGALRGVAQDRARLVEALSGRGPGGVGGSVASSPWASVASARGGGGGQLAATAGAPAVGASQAGVRAGTRGVPWPGDVALDDLSGAGPSRPGGRRAPQAAPGGLPALGTSGGDAAVAARH